MRRLTYIHGSRVLEVQYNAMRGLVFLPVIGVLSQSIVVFFDDDFRPHSDWLRLCVDAFSRWSDVGALSGLILADGVNRHTCFDEEEADHFLDGTSSAQKHWATGERRNIGTLYGCNMAFRGRVLETCRFDEELPLYGWQEDRDIAGQVRRKNRVILEPNCQGVHLGAGSGRTSGLRLGYSQIANIVYLARKGTVEPPVAFEFLTRALASNTVHAIFSKKRSIYLSRLRGNLFALTDLAFGRCRPRRIVNMQ